jgi:spore coat protein A
MAITRRKFLGISAVAGASMLVPWKFAVREAWAQYGVNSPNLIKFVQPLRSVGGLAGVFNPALQEAIPLASSDGTRIWGTTTANHYTIEINPFSDLLHPGPAGSLVWGPTPLWGYNPVGAIQKHLGGIIVSTKNSPTQITFRNNLPPMNIIPVDTTIPGANQAQNRTAVHLHGGYVPWISDGGPHDWWAPDGTHGMSFLNNQVLNPAAAINEAEYYYPNDQSARLVWYHDHAWGITRTNAYAGVASGYVITDPEEAVLVGQGVPGPADAKTFYMVFQDKIFNPNGSLFYANIYDFALFGPAGVPSFGENLLSPPPVPSCVPEFFGDTILVNGTVYPYIEVEPRRYRFRLLNACNARFLNPRLVYAMGKVFPENTEPDTASLGPGFTQIGTEGGFLPAPVLVDGKAFQLLLAPAERADIIVDFSKVKPGKTLILYNDAPGPFPGGAAIFDFNPKNTKTPTSIPGYGPNTRTLLQIRVKPLTGTADAPLTVTLPLLYPPALVNQVAGVPNVPVINRAAGTATVGGVTGVFRSLTLNEGFDEYGRLAQFIGTDVQMAGTTPGFFGRRYMDTPTEIIQSGAIEIWEIANLSADTHPLHFHLVNVQVLARQAFNMKTYAGVPNLSGPVMAPDPNELGWKETVRMNPGEVIWVIAKYDLAPTPFPIPPSPRTDSNEYVWHCHILEHEEHDMMRPVIVTGANPVSTPIVVSPASNTIAAATGGTADYVVTNAAAGYIVASDNVAYTPVMTATGFQVIVAAGAALSTVTFTVSDGTPNPNGTPRTATATLVIN